MGFNNRELEKKFHAIGKTPSSIVKIIESLLSSRFVIDRNFSGSSIDYYWKSPNPKTADFLRLRLDTSELTVKHTDKGNVSDRVEIDVPLVDVNQTYAFMNQVFGKPQGKIIKHYTVMSIDDHNVEISVYKVKGSKITYVEVEARNQKRLDWFVELIKAKVKLKLLNKSLYQLVLKQ